MLKFGLREGQSQGILPLPVHVLILNRTLAIPAYAEMIRQVRELEKELRKEGQNCTIFTHDQDDTTIRSYIANTARPFDAASFSEDDGATTAPPPEEEQRRATSPLSSHAAPLPATAFTVHLSQADD